MQAPRAWVGFLIVGMVLITLAPRLSGTRRLAYLGQSSAGGDVSNWPEPPRRTGPTRTSAPAKPSVGSAAAAPPAPPAAARRSPRAARRPEGFRMRDLEGMVWGSKELDDGVELKDVGFPPEALNIRGVNLCHPHEQPKPPGGTPYTCATDPSCIKCQQPLRKASVNSAMNWYKTAVAPVRKSLVTGGAPRGAHPVLVAMPLNASRVEFFRKWACAGSKLHPTLKLQTLVVALDAPAHKAASALGFHAIGPVSGAANPGSMSTVDLADIALALVALSGVDAGRPVLLMRPVGVWHHDPLAWLTLVGLQRDIVHVPQGGAPRGPPSLENYRMLYLKSNQRTKVFMKTLVNLLPVVMGSTGGLWERLLYHYKFRQIEFDALPGRLLGHGHRMPWLDDGGDDDTVSGCS